jgi:rhomboid family GlyGly-CTERM serine protease
VVGGWRRFLVQRDERRSSQCLPWVSLTLVVIAVAVMPLGSLSGWLQYDRTAVENGQLWRIVTCQLTHWSWNHLLWDAAALALLGSVLERIDRRAMLVCLGISGLVVPAVVHFGLPELVTYRGLSGIDSAVFVLLAVLLLRQGWAEGDHLWTAACLTMLAGFTAKIGFEVVTAGTLFVDAQACNMLPVPWVHVAGGLLGAACGLLGKSRSPLCRLSRPSHSGLPPRREVSGHARA